MKEIEKFMVYFSKAPTEKKRIILTRAIICLYCILLYVNTPLAIKLRKGFGTINFGMMYGICTLMIFFDDLTQFIQAKTCISSGENNDLSNFNDRVADSADRIDGISIEKLILHLVEFKGLPTNETKEIFGINNEQLKKLGDNLERVGILERGKNNARVLTNISNDVLIDIVSGACNSDDLRPALLQLRPGVFEIMK